MHAHIKKRHHLCFLLTGRGLQTQSSKENKGGSEGVIWAKPAGRQPFVYHYCNHCSGTPWFFFLSLKLVVRKTFPGRSWLNVMIQYKPQLSHLSTTSAMKNVHLLLLILWRWLWFRILCYFKNVFFQNFLMKLWRTVTGKDLNCSTSTVL